METNDHLRKTLDHYRQQRQQKLDELRPLELMIRQLEHDLGEASSNNGISEIKSLPDGVLDTASFNRQQPAIRPDEFFTMTQSDAAKNYLKKVGHAISFDELVGALRKGGAQLGGADPKRTLYVSLARNPNKEFVWPSPDHIGLSEFYPGRARATAMPGNRLKKNARKKKPGGKRGRPPKSAKGVNVPADPKHEKRKAEKKPTEVAKALHDIMQDGKARSKDDIAKEVEAKLGHPVAKIAIFGTLANGKGYEEIDGQYRFTAVQ